MSFDRFPKSYCVVLNRIALIGLLFTILLSGCAPAAEQVITGDPRTYLLNTSELPSGEKYFVPEGDAFLIPNEAAISELGVDKANQLMNETQRVSAGRVHYQISDTTIHLPQVYLVSVVIHQNAQAARTAVEKYNIAALYPDGGWKVEKDAIKLGDIAIVETGESQDTSGHKATSIRIEFAYRNASVDVLIFGLSDTVTAGKAEQIARSVLAKLQTARLSTPPVPTLIPETSQ